MSNQLLTDLGMKGAYLNYQSIVLKDNNVENPKEMQYFEN
jgi:hypothetical protein